MLISRFFGQNETRPDFKPKRKNKIARNQRKAGEFVKKSVYLDGAATTPLDRKVYKSMKPYLKSGFVGNTMSIHPHGVEASVAVENARQEIGHALKVPVDNIIFTSGATEGNNQVVNSYIEKILNDPTYDRDTIICSTIEHDSVLVPCKRAKEKGVNVIFINPTQGYLKASDFVPYINNKTALVCCMALNNETGLLNETYTICSMAKDYGAKTLVDCTQVISYCGDQIHIGVNFKYATYMTLSAHKIYGPAGVGCLIARDKKDLLPLNFGGAQEKMLRGGTMNVCGIVGMATALKKAEEKDLSTKYKKLYNYFCLLKNKKRLNVVCNFVPDHKNIISIQYTQDLPQDLAQLLSQNGVSVSAGSACDANHDADTFNGSHVLLAMGMTEQEIRNTVRISFIKSTTKKDIRKLIKALKEVEKYGELYRV